MPALAGCAHVAVIDHGFGWWPGCNVVERALVAAVPRVTFLTPGTAFAGGIPAESRVQLLQRLAGAGKLDVVPLCPALAVTAQGVIVVHRVSGASSVVEADRVVVVGERRPRSAPECDAPLVLAIGDMVAPRRAAHAIAEGCEAAVRIVARRGSPGSQHSS
jgi:2,4-dienoyl-CoA reductase (NADPH2)